MRPTTQDSLRLLDAISRAQEHYISGDSPEQLFARLLDGFLELTASESGFIGVVTTEADGVPRVEGRAVADLSEARIGRSRPMDAEFGFDDPDTLLGAVLARREPVISNAPDRDGHRTGLPESQPVARSFMGLPILHRGEPIGVIAVINRNGGYDEGITGFLKPLLRTYSQLIRAMESDREAAVRGDELARHRDRLEADVTDRTGKLAESEALYHTLFDLSPDSIVTFRDGGGLQPGHARPLRNQGPRRTARDRHRRLLAAGPARRQEFGCRGPGVLRRLPGTGAPVVRLGLSQQVRARLSGTRVPATSDGSGRHDHTGGYTRRQRGAEGGS